MILMYSHDTLTQMRSHYQRWTLVLRCPEWFPDSCCLGYIFFLPQCISIGVLLASSWNCQYWTHTHTLNQSGTVVFIRLRDTPPHWITKRCFVTALWLPVMFYYSCLLPAINQLSSSNNMNQHQTSDENLEWFLVISWWWLVTRVGPCWLPSTKPTATLEQPGAPQRWKPFQRLSCSTRSSWVVGASNRFGWFMSEQCETYEYKAEMYANK